jgi:plastocyanin
MTRILVLGVSLLAAVALLGACSDDDGDETSGGTRNGDAVSIEDFSFEPQTIEVVAGTEVTWANGDDFAHTVTARDDSFASGDIDSGAGFSQAFEDAGEYEYFCSIHNSMTGTVVVE